MVQHSKASSWTCKIHKNWGVNAILQTYTICGIFWMLSQDIFLHTFSNKYQSSCPILKYIGKAPIWGYWPRCSHMVRHVVVFNKQLDEIRMISLYLLLCHVLFQLNHMEKCRKPRLCHFSIDLSYFHLPSQVPSSSLLKFYACCKQFCDVTQLNRAHCTGCRPAFFLH